MRERPTRGKQDNTQTPANWSSSGVVLIRDFVEGANDGPTTERLSSGMNVSNMWETPNGVLSMKFGLVSDAKANGSVDESRRMLGHCSEGW